MPEYYFHVNIELFPDSDPSLIRQERINLSASHALRPFLRPAQSAKSRDKAFDSPSSNGKTNTTPKTHHLEFADRARRPPSGTAGRVDRRADHIQVVSFDMEESQLGKNAGTSTGDTHIEKGIGTSLVNVETKGRFESTGQESTGQEWGVVHLYRDAHETTGLYKKQLHGNTAFWNGADSASRPQHIQSTAVAKDVECTTLCILAVPSYLNPADFIAFVGPKTRDQVSHFRMIRTMRTNRYMVLMKFKHGKVARQWQSDWNGRVFNSMEPETCHVVFLKSVEITHSSSVDADRDDGASTFPRMTNDPFASKPPAPPTPALVELPTCPVCLERMDETTGLLTILCQHVFHCSCLEKWSGGGCPVCRYTHDDFSTRLNSHKYKNKMASTDYDVVDELLECETCHAENSLWQCLICGRVGCGRYEGKHAYQHFEESGHTFSMDLESKRVWDYAADVYVHRIIESAAKPGEKLVELPGRRRDGTPTALERDDDIEAAKMDNVALEYTHLLTSQLDSQRVYFEEIVERMSTKAIEASRRTEQMVIDFNGMRDQLAKLTFDRDELQDKINPDLEAERARLAKRNKYLEDLAKSTNSRFLEEKSVASGLSERVKFLEESKLSQLEKRIQELEEENATKDLLMEGLRDEHRDAMMQVSAASKLQEMIKSGELDEEELRGATIEAGPAPSSARRKGKQPVKPALSGNEATPPSTPSCSELAQQLAASLNVEVSGSDTSATWSDETVTQLMAEIRAHLLEKGLVAEKPAVADPQTENDPGSSAAKKKKRGKKSGRR